MARAPKVVLLGDHGVGKTCLVSRWVKDAYRGDQPATIGAAFSQREVVVNGQATKIQIWDTAGEERYQSMAPVYSRGALGAMIVFDVARRESLASIPAWVKCLAHCDTRIVVVVAANKSDVERREVSFEEGDAYARERGFVYFETSAKTGAGVEEAFGYLAERVLEIRASAEEPAIVEEKPAAANAGGCC
jgi:small GTP-binding protein